MAGKIGLHWSPSGLVLVEGQRQGPQLAISAHLHLPTPFAPEQADSLGQQLKSQWKSAGFSGTSVCGVVSRDLLICRDIRYPAVTDEERPSIIQFQTLKEVTLSPNEAVIDFQPVAQPWPTGELRALSWVMQRSHLAAYQRLCMAAGLKLESIVPSSLALLANGLAYLKQPEQTTAFLVGNELFVSHDRELLYSRPMDPEEPLGQEIRQGLAAFSGLYPRLPVQELFVAGAEVPDELEGLVGAFRVPVRWYNPLTSMATGATPLPDAAITAASALQLATGGKAAPAVNFVSPKKDKPKPNRKRFYAITGGTLAAALLILGGGFYWLQASEKDTELATLQTSIAERKKEIAVYGNLEDRANAFSEWDRREMVLLDELYELAARFPDSAGVRITEVEWQPFSTPSAAVRAAPRPAATNAATSMVPGAQPRKNTKPVGKLVFVVQADAPAKLEAFRRELDRGHWSLYQWDPEQTNPNQRQAVVHVFEQEAGEYVSQVQPGTHRTQPGEIRPEGTRPGQFRGNRGTRPPGSRP